MKSIREGLKNLMAALGAGDDKAKESQRIAEVNYIFKEVIQAVYGKTASLVFRYINTVYIMSGEDGSNLRRFDRPKSEQGKIIEGKVLVIYSNDSTIRSDLDARQEFIKLKMRDKGETIEAVKIIPSMFEMKDRHPFLQEPQTDDQNPSSSSSSQQNYPLPPLSPEEYKAIETSVASVENDDVKYALKKAMTADLQRKNALNMEKDRKN